VKRHSPSVSGSSINTTTQTTLELSSIINKRRLTLHTRAKPPLYKSKLTRKGLIGRVPYLLQVQSSRTIIWDVSSTTDILGSSSLQSPGGYLEDPQKGLCLPYIENPFRRVLVDYLILGGARISWELNKRFNDLLPYSYQLQVSESGTSTSSDWINVGSPKVNTFYLIDDRRRLYGKTWNVFYRVILTTPNNTYTSPSGNILGRLRKQDWLLVREVLREEKLRLRTFATEGWLLKAKRAGLACACKDPLTGEVRDGQDPICYGTGFVGGYYQAVPCTYTAMESDSFDEDVNLEGVGTEKKIVIQARFAGVLPLQSRDAFVSTGSDERYYMHTIREVAHWRSVPLAYEVELRVAPTGDVIYSVPLLGSP
jgi:hypothetical protein